jgi:hypothetical protein
MLRIAYILGRNSRLAPKRGAEGHDLGCFPQARFGGIISAAAGVFFDVTGKSSMIRFCGKSSAFVASFIGAALVAGSVLAQTTAPRAKAPKKATSSAMVVIANSRAVALTELDATPAGRFLPKVLLRNLAPGKKASVSVATDEDCVFNLHGAYADQSSTELPNVDLCKDKNVNLVD